MSKKPPQENKKKKFVAPSQNELAKKEYIQLDEEEIEHLKELDSKYRDRAKERREGILDEDEEYENFDDENLLVEEGDEEYYTTVKGLDYELLKKQREKDAEENGYTDAERFIDEQKRKENERMEQSFKERKDMKASFRTVFGANIHRALFTKPAKREGRRNIFKSSNFYEFDVDLNFGSTLPKLVIRSRENKEEQEQAITAKVGDNILGKINKIMTYIKTGKKVEHKKEPHDNKFQKALEPKINPISTQNMSDEDDEDSIFPDAKKKIKTEEGPRTALFKPEEPEEETKENKGEQKTVKGLFSSLKPDQDTGIEEEAADVLEAKKIAEKNRKLIAELSQKRAEEKLAQLQHKGDDYYTECFQQETPELEELKNRQNAMGGNKKKNKSKKRELNKQFDKVTKIMTEKRGGGGPKSGAE